MKLDRFLSGNYSVSDVERGFTLTLSEITTAKVEATIDALSNFTLKVTLYLDVYNAEPFQVQCVFEALNKNRVFESIGISYKSNENGIDDFASFPPVLVENISKELKKNTLIRGLNVLVPRFQNETIADTFFSFLASNTIMCIKLTDCSDPNAYKALIKAVKLRQVPSKLEFVNDDSAPLMDFSLDIIDCFAINDGFNTTLESLKFDGIDFTNNNVVALMNLLGKYRNLTKLSVVFAGLSEVMVPALVNLLKTNSNLTVINFNSNGIGNTGLRLLGDALKTNQTVRSINLVATGHPHSLDAEDAVATGWGYLYECLKSNTTLTEIIVGGDDEGVEDLDFYPQIKEILERNQVKNKATSIDENMSDKLNTLEHLDLKNTPIGGSWGVLTKMLGKMPALKRLSLSNNNIHDDFTQHLRNPDLEGVVYKLFPELEKVDTVTTEQRPNKICKLN